MHNTGVTDVAIKRVLIKKGLEGKEEEEDHLGRGDLNTDKRQSFFGIKLEVRIDAEKTAFTGCLFLLKNRYIDWNIRFVHPGGQSAVSYFMCISFRQVFNLCPGKFDDRKIR